MTYRSEIGQFGENLACEYLVKGGYKIIERNFRQKWGEIDIIAKAPDKTLVFVEVKTRSSIKFGEPSDAVVPTKIRTIAKIGMLYALKADLYSLPMQIDVVSLLLDASGKVISMRHIKNVSQ